MADLFQHIGSVAGPFSLAAFAIAAVASLIYYTKVAQLRYDIEMTSLADAADRPDIIRKILVKHKLGNPDKLTRQQQKELLEKELAVMERRDERRMKLVLWLVVIAAGTGVVTYTVTAVAERIPGIKEARLDGLVHKWNDEPIRQARIEEAVYWHHFNELPICEGEPRL